MYDKMMKPKMAAKMLAKQRRRFGLPRRDRFAARVAEWLRLVRHPRIARYRQAGAQSYDNLRYWRIVGQPLLQEAFRDGGFWTQVFDPDRARASWTEAPDDLAILHILSAVCASTAPR
ncbi:MAG: hypothetical protein NTW86_05125 [Candidatus Sumerlaeota bacterium]|nr:hypothetical protein [Candidatus Sumerlaeota bacterium]